MICHLLHETLNIFECKLKTYRILDSDEHISEILAPNTNTNYQIQCLYLLSSLKTTTEQQWCDAVTNSTAKNDKRNIPGVKRLFGNLRKNSLRILATTLMSYHSSLSIFSLGSYSDTTHDILLFRHFKEH